MSKEKKLKLETDQKCVEILSLPSVVVCAFTNAQYAQVYFDTNIVKIERIKEPIRRLKAVRDTVIASESDIKLVRLRPCSLDAKYLVKERSVLSGCTLLLFYDQTKDECYGFDK